MKKIYIVFALFFAASFSLAQNEFITTWEVDYSNINIYTDTSNYTYNYTIDFGDGTILYNVQGDIYHSYQTPGIYTISISGDFPYFNLTGQSINNNPNKLKKIIQWGNINWKSFEATFKECENLIIQATDAPNLSQVTSLREMFYNCNNLNQSINHWNVSNVTDMSSMFEGADNFNKALDNWDVSNVIDMSYMFDGASSFNQNINSWDVSSVVDMTLMFSGANSFNQNINSWNVSSVENMSFMFSGPNIQFNQPLNDWDVSNVTNMWAMFSNDSFNQPLNNWDVSSVTNMSAMFLNNDSFNQSLNNWDVSNVVDMTSMFSGTTSFNQPLNNWNVLNVTEMESIFRECISFNQPLNDWDVSNVTNMRYMFEGCSSFNQPLSNWDVSNVTSMVGLFRDCNSFNQPLNDWDVSNVSNIGAIFDGCSSFNQPLNNWDVSNVTNMSNMFSGATSFNQSLNDWDVSNATRMYRMFDYTPLFNQDISSWVFTNVSGIGLKDFLKNSGLNITNYDKLLTSFANSGITNMDIGVQNLEYCNGVVRSYLESQGCTFNGDIQSSNCNTISGTIYYDFNNNGCDTTDTEVSNLFVITEDDNTYTASTLVNNSQYMISVYGGSHTVSIQSLPTYFTASPVSATVDFSTSNTEQVDFCLTKNQTVEDLNITLITLDDTRPGFEATYKLIVQNVGTEVMNSVNANFTFDDTMQTFTSAVPNAISTTANSANFDFGTINPFQSKEVLITMQTFTPPTVNGDDILNFTATVTPSASDYTPNDNTYNLQQIVVNSYDPNDKRVMQGEEITIDQADEYLDYIIRFQNTGSANATFVRIEDVLHENLDWSTLKIISASHDYSVKIDNGKEVEFYFDNINLPYQAADDAGSNGYIAYKIKPKSTVQIGDVMSGDASIYFDYNLPIITNVASTTIVNSLGVEEFSYSNFITVYPNPVENELHINVKNGVKINKIEVYDLQGHLLIDKMTETNIVKTSKLASGIYMLNIESNRGVFTEKIIKK